MGIFSKLFKVSEPTNDEKFQSIIGSTENIFRVVKVSIENVDSEHYIINRYAGKLPTEFSNLRSKLLNKMPEKIIDYDQFIIGCKSSVIAKINIIRNKSGDRNMYTQLEQIINSI